MHRRGRGRGRGALGGGVGGSTPGTNDSSATNGTNEVDAMQPPPLFPVSSYQSIKKYADHHLLFSHFNLAHGHSHWPEHD